MLTVAENQPENSLLPAARYQTLVYVGRSLQTQGEYRRAESIFKEALQYAKATAKTKIAKTSDMFKDGLTEIGEASLDCLPYTLSNGLCYSILIVNILKCIYKASLIFFLYSSLKSYIMVC